MDFKGKVCVVTGGANGIGRCISLTFAKAGAHVAIIDLDKDQGEKVLVDITAQGVKGIFFCGDIAKKETLDKFAEEVIRTYGNIDYLINNACLSRSGILSGCDYEDFNDVLNVGITAPYMLSKLFLHAFAAGGAIVNISSTRSTMSQADTESYTAAKGGISALTHALAISLAGKVRVNSVSPGWIDVADNNVSHTQPDKSQHPVKRIGKASDIARAVMFLCDAQNDFITGENITVDGGMTKQMTYSGENGWVYEGK